MRPPAFPSARQAARKLISDITLFSRSVIRLPLRPYQAEPLNAILESIFCRHGREFLEVGKGTVLLDESDDAPRAGLADSVE